MIAKTKIGKPSLVLSAFALSVAVSICAQESPLTVLRSVSVDDSPRPVSSALEALMARYRGVVITYEDPLYAFSGDMKDVALDVRRDLNRFEGGQVPPVFVPRGGSLTVTYSEMVENGEPADWARLVEAVVAQHNLGKSGGTFSVKQTENWFHVVPASTRNAHGIWQNESSMLETLVTVYEPDSTALEAIARVTSTVSSLTGRDLHVGTVPIGLLTRTRVSIETGNKPARDVVMDILMRTSDATGVRLTWLIFNEPGTDRFALNVKAVGSRSRETAPPPSLPSNGNPGDRSLFGPISPRAETTGE